MFFHRFHPYFLLQRDSVCTQQMQMRSNVVYALEWTIIIVKSFTVKYEKWKSLSNDNGWMHWCLYSQQSLIALLDSFWNKLRFQLPQPNDYLSLFNRKPTTQTALNIVFIGKLEVKSFLLPISMWNNCSNAIVCYHFHSKIEGETWM